MIFLHIFLQKAKMYQITLHSLIYMYCMPDISKRSCLEFLFFGLIVQLLPLFPGGGGYLVTPHPLYCNYCHYSPGAGVQPGGDTQLHLTHFIVIYIYVYMGYSTGFYSFQAQYIFSNILYCTVFKLASYYTFLFLYFRMRIVQCTLFPSVYVYVN